LSLKCACILHIKKMVHINLVSFTNVEYNLYKMFLPYTCLHVIIAISLLYKKNSSIYKYNLGADYYKYFFSLQSLFLEPNEKNCISSSNKGMNPYKRDIYWLCPTNLNKRLRYGKRNQFKGIIKWKRFWNVKKMNDCGV